jgi:hypothetical protein
MPVCIDHLRPLITTITAELAKLAENIFWKILRALRFLR